MKRKKSQSSLEFLMVFGIGFAIILVLSGIFFSYFNSEKKSLDKKHLENIGNEIMQNIERVYFLGNGNRITINTNFPEAIENISIHHNNNVLVGPDTISFDYLNITYFAEGEISSLFFETSRDYIRFTCTNCSHSTIGENVSYFSDSSKLSAGNKKIRIESKGDEVEISFVR